MIRLETPTIVILVLFWAGCGSTPTDSPHRSYAPVDTIDGIPLYRVYSDSFQELPLQMKIYAYHLVKACQAGRDMAFHRTIPHGLEIIQLMGELVLSDTSTMGKTTDAFLTRVWEYYRKFRLWNGNYDRRTGKKFSPRFDLGEMFDKVEWMRTKGMTVMDDETIQQLNPYIFDVEFLPTLDEARHENFGEKPPAIVANKSGGSRTELIVDMTTHLEAALTFAPNAARPALTALIRYLNSGDYENLEKYRSEIERDLSVVRFRYYFHDGYWKTTSAGIRRGTKWDVFGGIIMIESSKNGGTDRESRVGTYEVLYAGGWMSPFLPAYFDDSDIVLSNLGSHTASLDTSGVGKEQSGTANDRFSVAYVFPDVVKLTNAMDGVLGVELVYRPNGMTFLD